MNPASKIPIVQNLNQRKAEQAGAAPPLIPPNEERFRGNQQYGSACAANPDNTQSHSAPCTGYVSD